MKTRGILRQPAVIVLTLISAICCGGWALSSQAFATGSGRAVVKAGPVPGPALPPGVKAPAATPLVAATNAHCGQVITASLTLNGDLYCPNAHQIGLTVAGTGAVTLNLNGHQIDMASVGGACIEVTGTSDVVESGTLQHCGQDGLQLTGSKGTATKLVAYENTYGIIDSGTSDKVISNTVIDNSGVGIYAVGTGGTVATNRVASNSTGIDFEEVSGTVSGNSVDSNAADGLIVYAFFPTTTVSGNSANFNANTGIDTSSAISDGGGNTAHGNWYASGGTGGQQCRGVACS